MLTQGRSAARPIIILVLAIASCLTGFILYSNIRNETIIVEEALSRQIEATTAAAGYRAKAEQIARSKAELASIVKPLEEYGTRVGAYVIDISNGASASVNPDQQFVSASLFKLFVAYGIYQKVDGGEISLSDTINSYGTTRTIDECLDIMITLSDNNCGYSLGTLYGATKLDEKLASEGYSGTVLNNADKNGNLSGDKQTTARDVSVLLAKLYRGELLSADSTSRFLTYLKANEINNRLPIGLPAGTVIAHKTGDLYGYVHDAGIIYGAKKDVIVVLLSGEWDYPATEPIPIFRSLSNSLWNYIES